MRQTLALLCAFLLLPRGVLSQTPAAKPEQPAAKLTTDQLDSLVSPIALYPDPLLAQVLAAATYPLEIVEASQWLAQNTGKKTEDLVDTAKKQDWDASVQALVAFPDLVKRLAADIKWTTDLGNAFLAQQSDVMAAVQRMRKKAHDGGKLTSNEQQKVEVKTEDAKQVIVVQPANPQVVYVPTYNPTVIWGPPVYPYPPIYYPPPPPPGAYIATAAISFGVGVAVGAAFGGWGWGWGCGWGGNTVIVNNNFFVHNNYNRFNNVNINNNHWQHNSIHRQGVPYANRDIANQFHGIARQDMSSQLGRQRQMNEARERLGRQSSLGSAGSGERAQVRNPQGFSRDNLGDPGSRNFNSSLGGNRGSGAFSGINDGGFSRTERDRGLSGLSSARSGGFSGAPRGGGFSGGHRGGGGFRRR